MEHEVVVELLGEGGSRALYAVRDGERWLFAMDFIEHVDPPRTRDGSPVAESWSEALELLDAHSGWYMLAPDHVHPEFQTALLRAGRRGYVTPGPDGGRSPCRRARPISPTP